MTKMASKCSSIIKTPSTDKTNNYIHTYIFYRTDQSEVRIEFAPEIIACTHCLVGKSC